MARLRILVPVAKCALFFPICALSMGGEYVK